MLIFTLVLFSLLQCTYNTEDPCTNYANLNDPRRSTAYARIDSAICDATITEQWYRSVSGAGPDMPTTPVPRGRCGAHFPIWINDTLPVQNVEKDVTACIRYNKEVCYWKINIKVKNCGDFNVYYLRQTPDCYFGYCFGTEQRCPDGQSSKTGFTPGCEAHPAIPLSLYVDADLTDGAKATEDIYHKVIKFDCKLQSIPDNRRDLLFEVRWYIEDEEVANFTEKKYAELSETALTEDRWVRNYSMGFNVKCKMRAKNVAYPTPGPFYESAPFYAGFIHTDAMAVMSNGLTGGANCLHEFEYLLGNVRLHKSPLTCWTKVDKTEVIVEEGGKPVDLHISLTVPVGCIGYKSQLTPTDCTVVIRLRTPNYQNRGCTNGVQTGDDLVFKNPENGEKSCIIKFDHSDYKTTKTFSITGKTDSLYNSNDRITYIRLRADLSMTHKAWTFASLHDIKVTVVDKEYELRNTYCSSNNDPIITTFDRNWFSNHRAGEFILYRHNKHPVSVQVMYSACPGWWNNIATCNCGVAIRNDDAMFIANFCGHITTHHYVSGLPTNRYVEQVSCDDKHMVVVHRDNEYEVILPIGTVVKFTYREVEERIIINNVIIKPSFEDIKSSSGLCGYFDNDYRNDLVLRDGSTTTNYSVFAEEWRFNSTKGDISLFAQELNLQKENVHLREYCVCGNTTEEITCGLSSAMELCRTKTVSPDLAKPFFIRCGEGRPRNKRSLSMYSPHSIYKRSAEDEDIIDRIELTYDSDYKDQPTEPVWMNGWNAVKAEAYCVKEFDSYSLVAACKDELPGYENEIEKIKNECIATIKIAGNTDFVFSSLAALRSSCLSEATRQENLTESASKSGNDSKTLLDDILDVSCVNNCSGNGTCVHGQCECFTGYDGAFCNLRKSIPPTISKTSNSWKCKTDQKPCRSYGITGSGFVYGSLTCKARHFEIFSDGRNQETDTVLTFAGTYVNEISCSCSFPSSRRRREASSETIIAEGYYMSVSNDGTTFSEEIIFINYDSSCYECNVTAITCTEHSKCVKETTTITSGTAARTVTTDSGTTSLSVDAITQSTEASSTTVVSSTTQTAQGPETTTIATDKSTSSVSSTMTSDNETMSSSTTTFKTRPTAFSPNSTVEKNYPVYNEEDQFEMIVVGILSACMLITALAFMCLAIKKCKFEQEENNQNSPGRMDNFSLAAISNDSENYNNSEP